MELNGKLKATFTCFKKFSNLFYQRGNVSTNIRPGLMSSLVALKLKCLSINTLNLLGDGRVHPSLKIEVFRRRDVESFAAGEVEKAFNHHRGRS